MSETNNEKAAGQSEHKPFELSNEKRDVAKHYSIRQAVKSIMDKKRSGLAIEISDELAKSRPYQKDDGMSFFIPTTLSTDAGIRAYGKAHGQKYYSHPRQTRDVTTTTDGAANTIFTQPGTMISYLYAHNTFLKLGPEILSGLTSPFGLPRQNATGGAYWMGEGQTSLQGDVTFDSITLNQHTLTNNQAYSNQLFNVSSVDIDTVIMNDMGKSFAIAIDKAFIQATGSNSPVGLLGNAAVQTATRLAPLAWR